MGHDARDRHPAGAQPPVGLEPERGGRDLRLHVGAPSRVALDELRVDRVVGRERGRHAAEPHHAARRLGERGEQLAGEREVAEDVRREDHLVAVHRGLAALRRVDDPGVQQQPVEAPPHPDARRGGTHRSEVAGVEQERLDCGGSGIRNPSMERGARRSQPVRVATGHEHPGTGAHQLLGREVAESGVGPGDEVGATGQVGEVLGVPATFGSWHDSDPTPGERARRSLGCGTCGPEPTSNAG